MALMRSFPMTNTSTASGLMTSSTVTMTRKAKDAGVVAEVAVVVVLVCPAMLPVSELVTTQSQRTIQLQTHWSAAA